MWNIAKLDWKTEGLVEMLLDDVIHPVNVIQEAGAKALAALLKLQKPEVTDNTLKQLLKIYHDKLTVSNMKKF